jgi:hypothetical protein
MSSIIRRGYGEDAYATGRFILDRARALGLSRTDLVRRLRYSNISNGRKALTHLLVHGLMPPLIRRNLAAALEVDQDLIDQITRTDSLHERGPRSRQIALRPIPSPIMFTENQLVLHRIIVENGPYMLKEYRSFVDADYTGTERASAMLGAEFVGYLQRYFIGWKLMQRIEAHPIPYRAGDYKIVHYVLSFVTDADAATVASHLRQKSYLFNFRYRRFVRGR